MIKNFFNYIFHRFPKNILSEKLLAPREREKESLRRILRAKRQKISIDMWYKSCSSSSLLSLAEGCNLEKIFIFFWIHMTIDLCLCVLIILKNKTWVVQQKNPFDFPLWWLCKRERKNTIWRFLIQFSGWNSIYIIRKKRILIMENKISTMLETITNCSKFVSAADFARVYPLKLFKVSSFYALISLTILIITTFASPPS